MRAFLGLVLLGAVSGVPAWGSCPAGVGGYGAPQDFFDWEQRADFARLSTLLYQGRSLSAENLSLIAGAIAQRASSAQMLQKMVAGVRARLGTGAAASYVASILLNQSSQMYAMNFIGGLNRLDKTVAASILDAMDNLKL